MSRLFSFMLIGLASGCAPISGVSEDAVQYNAEVEQTQNHLVLLNIVRASMHRPLHFTTFTTLRNRPRVTAGANLSLPFGAEAPESFEFRPTLEVRQGPSFDIAVLDSQELMRGLTSQVDILTLHSYVHREIPRQLVFSLFFEKITVSTEEGSETFYNKPGDRDDFGRFQAKLRSFVDQGLTTQPAELVRDIGPFLDAADLGQVPDLIEAAREDLTFERVNPDDLTNPESQEVKALEIAQPYRLREKRWTFRLCFERPIERLTQQAACLIKDQGSARGERRSFREDDDRAFSYAEGRPASFTVGDGRLDIHVRSVMASLTTWATSSGSRTRAAIFR